MRRIQETIIWSFHIIFCYDPTSQFIWFLFFHRSILQNWKKSLHIPLRLDIYYEYQTPSTTTDGSPTTTTRKELLERWCIDYLPHQNSQSLSSSSSPHQQQYKPSSNSSGVDETILQLRQVVKHVIVFLRVLNSFTRMMPGYNLHHALMEQKYQSQIHHHRHQHHGHYCGQRLQGGGPGLRGGYYTQQKNNYYNQNHHQHRNQQKMDHHSSMSKQQELISGSIKFLFCVSSDSPSVSSTTTSTSSTTNHHELNLTQQRLFSSTTNNPFARHDLTPITTPYGVLHLTALYDDGLNVERVMMDRARRLMEWDTITMKNNGSSDNIITTNSEITSRAIPIQNKDHESQQQQCNNSQHSPSYYSYQPHITSNSFAQQQNHQRNDIHFDKSQPMSLPNPTILDNDISGHLIHDYARSPVMNKGVDYHRSNSNSSQQSSNSNNNQAIRDRISSDPGRGIVRRGSDGKRVLSGLSLALMNDQENISHDHNPQVLHNSPSLSSSPLERNISTTSSEQEAASWKQRVALHHPPPTFESPGKPQQSGSSSLQRVGQMHSFGYGYNSGTGIPVPTQNSRDCHSPMPTVPFVNTPPQPLFIGSLPRGTDLARKEMDENKNTPLSPPFCNPSSLKEIPSSGSGSFQNSKSYVQQQRQFQTIGVSGIVAATEQGKILNAADNLLLPPLTTMDGLASNPFKVPPSGISSSGPNTGTSEFSSLTLGKGSAMAFGYDGDSIPLALKSGIFDTGSGYYGGTEGAGYVSSFGQGRSGHESLFHSNGHIVPSQNDYEDDANDMPFAVDETDDQNSSFGKLTSGSIQQTTMKQSANIDPNGRSTSSAIYASEVVTSFAHRCATAQRLKLFDSSSKVLISEENNRDPIDCDKSMAILSSQLDELKSFGESIMSST